MRSTNAESQERLFSQAKHISQRATNRKPENVVPTVLLSLQARQKSGEVQRSLKKQETVVSSISRSLLPFQGTKISKSFLNTRKQSWQAHMHRISPFLVLGENIWWQQTETEYQFFDSDTDPEYWSEGPNLMHFSEHMLARHNETWSTILSNESIIIPAPSIKLYDRDGNFTGTRHYPPQPQPSEPTNSQHSNNTSPASAHDGHEDDIMQVDYTTRSPQASSASLPATEGNQETTFIKHHPTRSTSSNT